ncbi:MAG: hypothetical protein JXB88_09850 [Spirochaetales bacterium]|nr:hypothetical protein [Spirochaetales bacterium]
MPVNRHDLVKRHNPFIYQYDEFSPLSVGNGELSFTADITGLQTFPEFYEHGIPLCTQAQWGWHTTPFSREKDSPGRNDFHLTPYKVNNRTVKYPSKSNGQEDAYHWLRKNPHRLHLGRIGLELSLKNGNGFCPGDLHTIKQKLDMWNGLLYSSFSVEDHTLFIKTCCHPELDVISILIRSSLLCRKKIRIKIAFPYGSPDINAADWTNDRCHSTEIISAGQNHAGLKRTLDNDIYFVSISYSPGTSFHQYGKNSFTIIPFPGNEIFELNCLFSPSPVKNSIPCFHETETACRKHWHEYWNRGGIIELAHSDNPYAFELERRIVLSQYLTAIQCSGSLPPQETGLTCNSWYGKFHLEMHWWHAVHFTLWERVSLLEKSMKWYISMLPKARAIAASQGYTGARWPKMTSLYGTESPSPINPFIIWQQPHPIYYAEMIYRSRPTLETLKTYRNLVFETASFMASFVYYENKNNRYVLGPPVIPAQENHDPIHTLNPAFELEYWLFGLKTAIIWRRRLGLEPDPLWGKIVFGLSSLPVRDGMYLAHEQCLDTFTKYNYDHPSMLAALGMLPGYKIDKQIMAKTLKKVLDCWQMDRVWGWDFPMIAMTAARLGMPEIAVQTLLYDSPENVYLPNGHNRQVFCKDLPVYLPGNGGLLTATGMMAAGWEGYENRNAPGFPADGTWKVEWENIRRML